MGFRVLRLTREDLNTKTVACFVEQLIQFSTFHGIDAVLDETDGDYDVVEITLSANSGYLNDLTDLLADSFGRIARDIDSLDECLLRVAQEIADQLRDQLVGPHGVDAIVPARSGREFGARIEGDGSIELLGWELDLQEQRVRAEAARYRSASGPSAWRVRHQCLMTMRLDSLAVVSTARRVRRVLVDLKSRISAAHLEKSLARFDAAAPHVVELRDIAEHLDEYAIGRGRQDSSDAEPGTVFDLTVDSYGVQLCARNYSIGVRELVEGSRALLACMKASADHLYLDMLLPGIADFEFAREEATGIELVSRCDESAEHAQFRAACASLRKAQRPRRLCEQCAEAL